MAGNTNRSAAGYHAGMYEHFEHTADLGLRVRAANLNTLFAEAAEALFAAVVEDLDTVEPRAPTTIRVGGTDLAYLLFDWLRELLRHHDEHRMLFTRFEVTVGETGLTATARGEAIDPARHLLSHEVKAITYHELKIVEVEGGFMAEVIVDI